MNSKTSLCVVLIPLVLVGGCIVGDQLTAITVHPDGSADVVVFRSNLHSTETGDRAEKELTDYKASFESRADGELARLQEVGGKAVQASWVRPQAPFSNFVSAHLPNASALEKFATIKDEDGGFQMATQFRSDNLRRSLTIEITVLREKGQSFPIASGKCRAIPADACRWDR